jgi:general secretion pathway protein E
MSTQRLGELLVAKKLIRPSDLEAALGVQASVGGLLGMILVRVGAVSESDLLAALSEQLGLPVQDKDNMPSPAQVEAYMDETGTSHAWWVERQAVAWKTSEPKTPIRLEDAEPGADADFPAEPAEEAAPDDPDAKLICAAVHPLDPTLRGLLEQMADRPVEWRLAPRSLISNALEDVRDDEDQIQAGVTDAARLRELAQEAPVIDFVNGVFAEALQRRASDIHVEPFEDKFYVRMRVDGILHTARTAPRSNFDAVASRIKLLSGMDIGERRLPQDGRQAIRVSGQEVDLRVSALPAAWGESMVLRLLGKTSRLPQMSELGLSDEDAARLKRVVDQPNGIVLVTGPTGSGKTTTIYRLLTGLNDGVRKIITVEDPVEFDLPGVVQVHVKADIGLTFAAGLRSILRQDPDIIMVGEIRDPETARIALQAALTGHVVISTVHTNSGLAAISRLLDLGVEDYLLADVMRGVVGQRLVRQLCPHCARPSNAEEVRSHLRATPKVILGRVRSSEQNWREPVGCKKCGGGGYLGRIGIFEIAPIGAEGAAAIRRRAGEPELLEASRRAGMLTMFEDGVLKAATGQTSLSEIFRVIGPVDPETDGLDHSADEPQTVY